MKSGNKTTGRVAKSSSEPFAKVKERQRLLDAIRNKELSRLHGELQVWAAYNLYPKEFPLLQKIYAKLRTR